MSPISLLLCVALAAAASAAPLAAANLRVEYLSRGVTESRAPRFSWEPVSFDRGAVQASYHIMVSALGGALVWDSGVVASAEAAHVAYAGTPLTSDTTYNYTIEWTDGTGATAPPSSGVFATGLLTQAEWATADWIGCPDSHELTFNQIRTELALGLAPGATIVQARAYLSALGYASLRVNGDWAPHFSGAHPRNDPGWTTYEVRALYSTYDLTNVLSATGPNAFAIALGNGWGSIGPSPGNNSALGDYAPSRRTRMLVSVRDSTGKTTTFGTTAGGFFRAGASAATWMCGAGAQLYDNVYNGVTYDARLETTGWDAPGFDAAGNWTSAELKADPGGATPTIMSTQAMPPISVQAEIDAIAMWQPVPGTTVFDFGQNFAGFVRLTLPAPVAPGVTITLRHAEVLQHPPYGPRDGSIYVGNLRSAKATDTYTTRGSTGAAEVWEPQFTYHGFRYVELTGLADPSLDTVKGLFIRTGVELGGALAFPATAQPLNQLAHAVQWGIGCNLMSVISDCPQRDERKGWMGDSGLSLSPTHYTYSMGAMYTMWAQNIRDSQLNPRDKHPVGSVPDTVPHTFGSYPSDPAWGTAYPGVVYSTWRMLGDTRIAADHYDNLALYIDFMMSRVNASGIAKLYQSYGDWCPPPATLGGGQGPKPPPSYTSGVSLLVDLQRMVELATALGHTADAAMYASFRAALSDNFNAAWLNSNGAYGMADGAGLQTASGAALAIGVVPAAAHANVSAALVADVATTHNGHWSTGIFGMRFLHAALTAIGQSTLALDTLLTVDYPGFGYWFTDPLEPATTLNELPDGSSEGPGMNSRNHHMFASVGGWLYEDLLGLGQARPFTAAYDAADPSAHGFRHAVIFPRATSHAAVPFASGSYRSIAGEFAVSWGAAFEAVPCVADAAENENVTLSCPGGGLITAVTFASFGTPTGTCAAGFAKGQCDAANSTAIVAAACVGKASCVIDVSTTVFGDPCFDVPKMLDAAVSCAPPALPGALSITVTVPANAAARVRLPFAGALPAGLRVEESGALVWAAGAFVPGVAGVVNATVGSDDLPVGTSTIDFEVLAGTFIFTPSV